MPSGQAVFTPTRLSPNPWLPSEIVENVDGRFLILPNDGIGGHLKRGDRWEPHFTRLVQHVLPRGATVIDAGANLGHHSVVMAKVVGPTGLVIAIEPQRIVFQQLCANAFLNGLTNVHAFQWALGAAPNGVVHLNPVDYFAPWVNIGDTRVGAGGETVSVGTLDAFQALPVSFIKLDVQGSELAALRGGSEIIRTHRPLLFLEVEEPHLRAMGTDSRELVQHLLSLRYVLLKIKNDYPVDHLCVPSEKRHLLPHCIALLDSDYEVIE